MNLNHNKNQLLHMTEDDYDNDSSFSVTRMSRKELKSKKRDEDEHIVHSVKNGKTYRKY